MSAEAIDYRAEGERRVAAGLPRYEPIPRIATYTDGSPVVEGDAIRYQQQPGGILPASGQWAYGIATPYPHSAESRARMLAYGSTLDPDELTLRTESGRYLGIVGHIVERADAPEAGGDR